MQNIYKQRLLNLATFLDSLPIGRFNYGHWVGDNWQGKQDLSCGTTACALGWATAMPEFQKLGLKLAEDVEYQDVRFKFKVVLEGKEHRNPFSAACEIFGIGELEAEYLFMPEAYYDDWDEQSPPSDATAEDVAAHIRDFTKHYQWDEKLLEGGTP